MSVSTNRTVGGLAAAAAVVLALVAPGTAHADASAGGASRGASTITIGASGVLAHVYEPFTRFSPGFKDAFGKVDFQMQYDGNMVVYSTGTGSRALWASNTAGNPGAYLDMQTDGNLVVYKPGNPRKALWSSTTAGCPTCVFAVQEDGNTVIYERLAGSDVRVRWTSNTAH
jgi:hypothetical protein